jgi:hypothetical protein
VDRFKQLNAAHGPISIAIDGRGPAARLIEPLRAAGFNVVVLTLTDVDKANGDFLEASTTAPSCTARRPSSTTPSRRPAGSPARRPSSGDRTTTST